MTKYIAKRFNKGNQSEVGGIRTGYYAVVEPKEVKTMTNREKIIDLYFMMMFFLRRHSQNTTVCRKLRRTE